MPHIHANDQACRHLRAGLSGKLFRPSAGIILLIVLPALASLAGETGEQTLKIRLEPATHHIEVAAQITVPDAIHLTGEIDFLLNAALTITRSNPEVREILPGDTANRSETQVDTSVSPPVKRYRLILPSGQATLSLEYQGAIDQGLAIQGKETARGFRQTAGIIGPQGIYLDGNSYWYPHFDETTWEFSLELSLPDAWQVISEGDGTARDAQGSARWESRQPLPEIHLVGGPLYSYRNSADTVQTFVYLHQPDAALAGKYLQATTQYLEMYHQLIGPYPYSKFALVENFWETGYGMPSFTLLGQEVIRFPFILQSSYPHEILHNWWGNSVFVDYRGGNWSEGLTVYLADYLLQEQQGKGMEYRRDTLHKYRDYVATEQDFPLTAFRERSSAASEAVGYGKAMMGFHMLRLQLGDTVLREVLARFYREFRWQRASFEDLRKTAEVVSGRSLERFWNDWVTRTGAAVLALDGIKVLHEGDAYTVQATLKQLQGGSPYLLEVPILLVTAQGAVQQTVTLDGAERSFKLPATESPRALYVDPDFDVFRQLDPREIPPAIGQLFGESRVLAVLPGRAEAQELEGYRQLLQGWQNDNHHIETKLDTEVDTLPPDRSVWLFGRENRLADRVLKQATGSAPTPDTLSLGGEQIPLAGHSVVVTWRHPDNPSKAVGWLFAESNTALAGLGRKLPHYGKYSYLVFAGTEPKNVLKGQWQNVESPLLIDLRPPETRAEPLPPLPPDTRKPLVELPPALQPAK